MQRPNASNPEDQPQPPSPLALHHTRNGHHAHVWQQQQQQQLSRPRSEESWIEVSSQPSSSSLSSSTNGEGTSTGVRAQYDFDQRRQRRRLRRSALYYHRSAQQTPNMESSSHEEDEESESEEDRVLSSSNEGLPVIATRQGCDSTAQAYRENTSSSNLSVEESPDYDEDDDDDDENSTAIDFPRSSDSHILQRGFTPQPHAFSHPPALHDSVRSQTRRATSDTYPPFTRPTGTQPYPRRSSYSRSRTQHSPYNVIHPSHQADHDAALRASLSTLLSCAAAARGLPKSNQQNPRNNSTAGPSSRVDPSTLRMVPESIALGGDTRTETSSAPSPASDARAAISQSSAKRKPNNATSTAKPRTSHSKKQRLSSYASSPAASTSSLNSGPQALEDVVSPTLLTWVLSAGVVVLVSAISFSAGYVVGRDAGPHHLVDTAAGSGGTVTGCAGEVMEGIERGVANASRAVVGAGGGWRRLRWSGGAVSSVTG